MPTRRPERIVSTVSQTRGEAGGAMSAVVYVEPEDDVRSVRAKMELVEGATIGVILPNGRPSFASQVAMRLLKREAGALALDLSVVTSDLEIRDLARAEGLRVFRSPAEYDYALRRRASQPDAPFESPSAPLVSPLASAIAIFVLLALLLGLVLVFVPEITVTVSPTTTTVTETIQIAADPSQLSVDLDRRRIPARPVLLEVDAVDQLPLGTDAATSDGRASGLVTFTNRTPESLSIPQGTIVATTTGIRFMTEQNATIPGEIGRTTKVRVVAEVSGDLGNVPRLRITTVQGSLETKVYVQNEDATAGGGVPGTRVVTAVDRDRLLKSVTDRSRSSAEAQIQKSLVAGDLLVGQSLQFTPLETTFDGEVGQEMSTLSVYFRAQASGLVVRSDDLYRIGQQAWVPSAAPGFEVVPGSMKARAPQVVGTDVRAAIISIQLEATTRAVIDSDRMGQLARWRTADEVRRLLAKAYDLSRPPDVRFSPGWAQRAFRVEIVEAP